MKTFTKKKKTDPQINPVQIKNHLWIFVNCLINNPTFDSLTKENMTSQLESIDSKCTLSNKFINNIKKMGIMKSVLSAAKYEDSQLQKSDNQSRLIGN